MGQGYGGRASQKSKCDIILLIKKFRIGLVADLGIAILARALGPVQHSENRKFLINGYFIDEYR